MGGTKRSKKKKHINEAEDSKKQLQHSKLLNSVTLAAQLGPPDPKINLTLKLAVKAAKAAKIAKSNIKNAIKKTTEKDSTKLHEATYEGYAPSDIGVIVETITDNIVRTHHNIKTYFNKYGGSLLSSGFVSHSFKQLGVLSYRVAEKKEEEMKSLAREAGADDCKLVKRRYEVYCKLWEVQTTKDNLVKVLGEPKDAKTIWIPDSTQILDYDDTKEVVRFLDDLQDQADVQHVYSNLEIPASYEL